EALKILDRSSVSAGDKTILAGDAIAFYDLWQLLKNFGDLLQLTGPWSDTKPRGNWKPQSPRADLGRITLAAAVLLQSFHPFRDTRRRQPDSSSQAGDGDTRVIS